ncbi:MAG: hypothetical protein N2447_06565, partial [Thermoanaerobaculum sp.]|nr:hypothetical protein [Thermoanaerobaculum sp.]
MRRVLLLVAFVYGADLYAAQRTLNLSQPAEGLAEVVVDVPVGDVTVTGCQCNQITAVVVISGKRWQLEEQDLVATVKGQSLQLSVKPQGREGKKLSADWSVKLPHHLA